MEAPAGVAVLDTKLAREATDLVRASTSDLVYDHSRRVYFWGSLQGRNRGLSFDPELLCIGAMFHDLGLNPEHRESGRRFEADSADEARSFLPAHGVPEDSIRRVWTAIALHTTSGIPAAFTDGIAPKPETTFGNVRANQTQAQQRRNDHEGTSGTCRATFFMHETEST
jgi:HD superfamily phosphodiesterase